MSEKLSRKARKYAHTPAVNQTADNACWAACLVWFCRAYGHGRPQDIDQATIMAEFTDWDDGSDVANSDETGSMEPEDLLNVWADDRWGLHATDVYGGAQLTAEFLGNLLKKGPVILGFRRFYASPSVNHLVVAYGLTEEGRLHFMDPGRYPGPDYTFVGAHCNEALSSFQGSSDILLAWPK